MEHAATTQAHCHDGTCHPHQDTAAVTLGLFLALVVVTLFAAFRVSYATSQHPLTEEQRLARVRIAVNRRFIAEAKAANYWRD